MVQEGEVEPREGLGLREAHLLTCGGERGNRRRKQLVSDPGLRLRVPETKARTPDQDLPRPSPSSRTHTFRYRTGCP